MTDRFPDEDWTNEYSRRDLQWIHDAFIGDGDLEDFFPESVPYWVECGFPLSDLKRAFDSAERGRMAIDNLVKIGDHHRQVAESKDADRHV